MHEQYALPEHTLDELANFLDGEANEHGLDFTATHGFLTALTIGPRGQLDDQALAELFDGQAPHADAQASAELIADLKAWQKSIHAALYHGVRIELPCALEVDTTQDTDLNAWCAGFMEALFVDEERWYAEDEDDVADMTMPMLVLSDLVEDDDLQRLRRDRKMINSMAREIPELITTIYLYFHAPEAA